MFEKIVQKILNRILGQYVEGFSSENLKIGLWSGAVEIKNVRLKKEIIQMLNLPFKLKYSKLGCLKMNIPWSNLTSSKIEVVVEGFELLMCEIPEKEWVCKNHKIIEQRKKEIQSYCEAIIQDFAKRTEMSKKEEEEQGYFGKMIVKIIDNIQVTVKNIHVRYEDEITNNYSFGVTLEELMIYTVNRHGEPEFIDRTKKEYENQPVRKKLILSELGVYWNEKSDFFRENTEKCMVEAIARKDKAHKIKMNYLILMSSNAMLYQREAGKQFVEPEINLEIGFNQLKIEVSNQQLQQIVTLSERLQKYTNEVKAQNRKKLTQLEMIANREMFLQLFPRYYENKISPPDLQAMESIIEKMEVANFQEGIKKYLQDKQKEKMMHEKREKSRGWFSGPKELTEEDKKEIETFIANNFGNEVVVVKRPEDFYYIRVDFSLKKLEIVIANQHKTKKSKEGIRAVMKDISMDFNLRQGGHKLGFYIDGINVDLFKRLHPELEAEETVSIIKKLTDEIEVLDKRKYISLKVVGNPLDKKHIDTDISLVTEELLIMFDPQLIKVATDFANIKISAKNTEAAFEAYGEIKNKASEAASESLKNNQKKKNFISLDVNVSAINLLLYFDPLQKESHVWALTLGQIQIYTDPETLKKPEFNYDEPMEKYCMRFVDISMVHFDNRKLFFLNKVNKQQISLNSRLLNDLTVGFEVEMFQAATSEVPKIRGKAVMHDIGLNLSAFTYAAVQKVGNCFAVEKQMVEKEEEKEKEKAIEKSAVMKEAKKIGILYEQPNDSDAKKYIAVLSGSYIYLYENKKDVEYAKYYYLKNAKFTYNKETLPHQKEYSVSVENSVNKVTLGFEKEQLMDDWVKAIKLLDESEYQSLIIDEPQLKKKETSKKQINHNELNFELHAEIRSLSINTILRESKSISIGIENLGTVVRMHHSKIVLGVSLKSITLKDNIYVYKYRQLDNFLYSSGFEGQDKLIDINIEQLSMEHPDYRLVDSKIEVNFGKLTCNYKPETVESLMLFFLPPPDKAAQPEKVDNMSKILDKQSEEKEKKRRVALAIVADIIRNQPEKFAMKVKVNIQEISVALVNCKNRVMFGKMGLNNFKLIFGQSTRRMLLEGSMEEMWFADYSKYPYTIYSEQDDYSHRDFIMSSNNHSRDMLTFNIQMLEIPNSKGKKMLINTSIRDLKVSYVQQPVLRILTYLTEQMLPSLTPSADPSKPKETPVNNTQPEQSPMELITDLENILVLVEPRSGLDEYLQLNISKIYVENNCFHRPFIKNPKSEEERVMVQNYSVKMNGIKILEKFKGDLYKLTNDLDFNVSCDLIQNAPYYRARYGERFQSGMRIDCEMSPFVMRINHDDYNFMMKCLNWNVTFDDNAEGYMFNGTPKPAGDAPPPDPFFMNIKMDKIALCVTENQFPLSVLLLNKMEYIFTMNEAGMEMSLRIKNFFGTYITQVDKELSVEKGMFNAFGYEQKLKTQELYEMENLVSLFSRNEMIYGESSKPDIYFEMSMGKSGDMFMLLQIEAMKINIELRNLLILSKLALMEESIQPPKSSIKAINKPEQAPPNNGGKMQIVIEMNNFMGSLSDKTGEDYVVMEGAFLVKLLMLPSKPESEVLEEAESTKVDRFRELASHIVEIKNFSFYFCNLEDLQNKRFILMPISLYVVYRQFYGQIKGTVFLETQIEGNLEKIIIEASVKDMLLLNKIMQDNLKTLSEVNEADQKSKEAKEMDRLSLKSEISGLTAEKEIDTLALEKTLKEVEKKIKNKMKANFSLEPMQIRVVNDCDNNFMPVMNFVLQESKILFVQDPIKSHLTQPLTMKLDFFNPRASSWEPVMETFQIAIDFLILNNATGGQTKIMVTSSEIEELKEMKINISTQFVASLMATLEIANEENSKMLKNKKSKQKIEVSPYIVENKTNNQVTIFRKINGKDQNAVLPPLFKGSLKLTENATMLYFMTAESKIKYSVSLEQYGNIRVNNYKSHLEFKVNKLNRVISFVNPVVVKNLTESEIYCVRFNEKKERLDAEEILMAIDDSIPLQKQWYVQFSFNKKTFTTLCPVVNLSSINFLKAESEKFRFSVTEKKTVGGHQIYYLRTPLIISNSLPKNIKLQFIKNGKTVSTKDIPAQTSHEVFANEQILGLRYKIIVDGFYWSQEFGANPSKFGEECLMYLNDRDEGGTTLKYIFEKVPKKNQFIFNIFCSAFIISELDYNVAIYGNNSNEEKNKTIEKYYKLGGQSEYWKQEGVQYKGQERVIDKITLVGAETGSKLRVCGQNCLIDFSQPVLVSGLGVNQARIVIEKEINGKKYSVFTMLGVEIELRKMVAGSDIICRQITLRSRSIVFNNSGLDLMIKEDGCEVCLFSIANMEKKPFYYTAPELKEKARGLIIKAPNTKQSIPILPNGLGSIYFRLELLEKEGAFVYFKLNIQEIKSYIYYEIKHVEERDLPYQVVVKSQNLEAYIPQFNRVMNKKSEPLFFINEIPHIQYFLRMQVRAVGTQLFEELNVEVDNLNYRKTMKFEKKDGVTTAHYPSVVYVIFNDSKKFIVIDENRKKEEAENFNTQTINLKLEKLSLSFVQNHAEVERPYESFYFYMSNFEFIMEKGSKITVYQTKLQFLQFDQEEPFNMANPVIITPSKYKQFTSTDPKDKPLAIFNSLIEIDNSFVKNLFFNRIVVEMNDLVVHAGTQFLKIAMQVGKEYQDVLKNQSQFYIKPKTNTWKQLEPPVEGSKTFIKSIVIAPFTIEISAELRLNQLDTESVVFFGTIVNALGVVITNIEGAPIVFDGIVINDCVDTMQGLNQKLIEHYKSSVMRQLYKVFGSLNIIGNPVSLFRNISTGFKDLKDKPSQGFVEGPLEFGKGLAQGTSSLIAHSVGGALGSVEKITGAVGSGLAALTFDKEFEEARQKQKMKKPKHVFEGLEKGGKAVFHGFKQGITGLFTKPYENTKKEGVIGFFKGAAQGVTGLVVKPVTGVVDFASKTTEGLKNTALYLQDKPNQNRIRYPRVFYSESSLIHEYNPIDSKLFAIVNKTKYEDKYGFENTMFIDSFMISNKEFLLVLKEDVISVEINDEKIEWAVPIEDLKFTEKDNTMVIESRSKREWYTGKVKESVKFKSKDDLTRMKKMIFELKVSMKDKNQRTMDDDD